MAVSAVLRLVYFARPLTIGTPKEHTNAHRRCLRLVETHCAPLLKSQSRLLLVSDPRCSPAMETPCTLGIQGKNGMEPLQRIHRGPQVSESNTQP